MGPAFLDLKIMCKCLARAIMRHLLFSRGMYMFLDDLKQAEELPDDIEFSYKFKDDLKIQREHPQLHTLEGAFPKKTAKTERVQEDFRKIEDSLMKRRYQMTFGQDNATFAAAEEARQVTEIEEDLERGDDELAHL